MNKSQKGESQISDPNSFSKEICESLHIMDIQNEVKSITTDSEPSPIVDKSLPQQPTDHISDQVSDPPTKHVLQYSQTNNGIISQISQYPDQKSLELEKSIDTQRELPNGSEDNMSIESKHQYVASHSLNDDLHGSALNNKSSIEQIHPHEDTTPKYTPESSHVSYTNPPSKNLQSQHIHSQPQEQNQNTYDEYPNSTKRYRTAYSSTKDSLHTNPDPKPRSIDNLLRSLCTEYLHGSDKHHDNHSHGGDEENEIPVRNRICMFKSITRFTDDIMKGEQNINYPIVSNETGKEEKQPNKYGGDEYRQNTTSHPVQTLSKGHGDHVLKQQDNSHTNVRNYSECKHKKKVIQEGHFPQDVNMNERTIKMHQFKDDTSITSRSRDCIENWKNLCKVERETGEYGGYQKNILTENFTDRDRILLTCPRCEGILRESRLSSSGERFCLSCMKRDEQTYPNVQVNKVVSSLKCCCPLSRQGCEWLGSLRDCEIHLNECGHVVQECKQGCGDVLQRNEHKHHMSNTCTQRRVTCNHCLTYCKACNLSDHIEECPKMKVSCKLECVVKM